ncbi:MAG: excinuclease ABC subunit UvrC [Candidatus Kapabacteria bacterium]|nr:excinuclease ABC subunit UvrC [Candidatus Kapabacteria bacterium]
MKFGLNCSFLNLKNLIFESEILEFENPALKQKLAELPTNPGVYQFKNSDEKIIYIGKAKNLRNRVRSYFQQGRPVDAKTKALIAKIADLEIILVDSEAEAFILEDTLIKKFKPRYNIMLRDDKSFPYIRITNEEFPRIFATRHVIRDGSKYFGPYTDARYMKFVLRTLRSIFLFRSCDLKLSEESISNKKFKICLDYHIKKCDGPCEGFISKENYNEKVYQAQQILNGRTRELEKQLEAGMEALAVELRFEDAANIRNRLGQLREYSAKQKIISNEAVDRDVFGIARHESLACSLILKIRDGKLIGKRHFIITNADSQSDESIITRTLERWYLESEFIPNELILQNEPDDLEFILDWLSKRKGRSITVAIPKIGDKKKIVEMAITNADFLLKEYIAAYEKREQAVPHVLLSLQRDLRLPRLPIHIECFDNSHIQGSELVSSVVVFKNGKPSKADYRKFKNKTVGHNDDFATMEEVVRRRYSRVIEENQPIPDLIVIDGGKGQLSSSVAVLRDLGIFEKLMVVGLAKRLEEVFLPEQSEPIILPRTSSSLRLLQHVRDEAHRFAITFHRLLRDKRTLQTELTEIDGIGAIFAAKLLKEFGSVEIISSLSFEEIKKVSNIRVAAAVKEYFKKKLISNII